MHRHLLQVEVLRTGRPNTQGAMVCAVTTLSYTYHCPAARGNGMPGYTKLNSTYGRPDWGQVSVFTKFHGTYHRAG